MARPSIAVFHSVVLQTVRVRPEAMCATNHSEHVTEGECILRENPGRGIALLSAVPDARPSGQRQPLNLGARTSGLGAISL
jgi:hypothetical protein